MDTTPDFEPWNRIEGIPTGKIAAVFLASLVVFSMVLSGIAAAPASAYDTETNRCIDGPRVPTEPESDPGEGELEIILTNDISASLTEDEFSDLKSSSKGFIDNLEDPDEVGAVSYSGSAGVDIGLTTDYQAVKDEIDTYEEDGRGGGTNTDEAIGVTQDELLDGQEATEGAEKVMILSSDGDSDDQQAAEDSAETARDNGILIYTVGIGDEADENGLIEIAGSEDRYYEVQDSNDLDGIYSEIETDVSEDIESEVIVDTRHLYEPGATHGYTVTQDGEDVTDSAEINTTNESLITVDESSQELTATSDENVSDWARIDATVNGTEGCSNVIVSQPTVENLELIPVLWKINATITADTIIFILISTLAAILGTRFASSFAGLGMFDVSMIMGWFIGYVNTGIVLLTVFASLFIGLNMAANIDYTVRR